MAGTNTHREAHAACSNHARAIAFLCREEKAEAGWLIVVIVESMNLLLHDELVHLLVWVSSCLHPVLLFWYLWCSAEQHCPLAAECSGAAKPCRLLLGGSVNGRHFEVGGLLFGGPDFLYVGTSS